MDIKKYKKQCKKTKKRRAKKVMKAFKHGKATSIEVKVREFLETLGCYFTEQFGVEHIVNGKKVYKVYDFYISGTTFHGNMFSFLIEADGTYWHAHKYLEGEQAYSKLSGTQKKNLKNDKVKDNIAKEKGLPLLRLSESDIKNNFKYVEDQIRDMINSFDCYSD